MSTSLRGAAAAAAVLMRRELANASLVEPDDRARVSVIVPTLNEVGNIDSLLAAILAQESAELNLDVLVADGGSTDGTADRVRRWEAGAPVRLVASGGGRGLAGDVLAAAELAEAPIIVVMDADSSHPPASIPELVGPLLAGERDLVVGSRYVPGGRTPGWPLARRFLSRLGGALAWPLADLRDPLSGFLAVRRDRLLAVDPGAAGFKIGLEIMVAGGDGLRVAEVPITFPDRVSGASKLGLFQLAAYGRRLLALAGGAVSTGTAARFAVTGLVGLAVDLLFFTVLYRGGIDLAVAHIASFAAATVVNYVLNARWSFAASAHVAAEPDWHRYPRFLAVCLTALFLRGGVLATAVNAWGWAPELAVLLGIAAGAGVNYLGSAFFVFPPVNPRISPTVRLRIAALGAISYILLLRFAFVGTIDLLPEEAYYWNYAQHLDIGYLDHPPMVAWLIWLGTEILGHTEFAVRSGAALAWLIAAFFLFRLTRNLYGKTAAFVAVLLGSALPFFFSIGFLIVPDAPLTAAWAGTLYFLERATFDERRTAWWGVGVCFGLGMLSKYTIALLGPAVLLFLLLDPHSRRWLRSPWPYAAAGLALLIFSPVIAWNAAHDWASFALQTTRRLGADPRFSFHLLVGCILLLVTPAGLAAAAMALIPRARARDRRLAFAAVHTLVPLGVFVAFSFFHQVKLNWTGPLWLAILPAIAHGIATQDRAVLSGGVGLRRTWAVTVGVALLFYGAGLHYLALGLPGVGYRDNLRWLPVAWRAFGAEATEIEEDVRRATGQKPLLVGMDTYFLASEIAFYGGDGDGAADSTAGRGVLGGNSLMYDYWYSDEQLGGRTLILFSLKPEDIETRSLAARFAELGALEERVVYKQGAPIGRFYYRVGYDFRP